MAVNSRIDNVSNEGFSLVIEDDGSGDLNRIMGELCKKHLESREIGEEKEPHSPEEIGREILQAISEEEETALDAELDKFDID